MQSADLCCREGCPACTTLSLSHERQGRLVPDHMSERRHVPRSAMFVPATRRVVMAPAHAQPGSGSVVERDDLVVGIDERHNRGEDGGPRARVKPGGAVAQIARALIALETFHFCSLSGVGSIIEGQGQFY